MTFIFKILSVKQFFYKYTFTIRRVYQVHALCARANQLKVYSILRGVLLR